MNIVYLIIFVIGSKGVTSQAIPQANLAQCQINAKQFNTGRNKEIVPNGYGLSTQSQSAMCIAGIK